MNTNNEVVDCRSTEGTTVGLIDALISVARVLAPRDLRTPAVLEALKDLADDEDIKQVLSAALYARSDVFMQKLMEDRCQTKKTSTTK